MKKQEKKTNGFDQINHKIYEQSKANATLNELKLKKAHEQIQKKNFKEAEKIYRELISIGTNNHIVYGNLAAICGLQGNNHEMIKLLEQAIKINPNYSDAHYNLGIVNKNEGNLSAAISSYQKAIQLNPNYSEAYYNLGNAFREKGDIKAAIASYQNAIKINPSHSSSHNNLGSALKEKGDIKASIESFKIAIQLNPNFTDAHYNLGNSLQAQGEQERALISYKKAIKLNPKFEEAYNNLGNILEDQGDIKEATVYYKKAIQLNPNFAEAHNNLGNILQEENNLKAAIISYTKAIKLNPNFAEAHNNLGNTLKEKGDIEKAITSYQKALQLKSNYFEAQMNLGNAFKEQGHLEKGIQSYKNALHINPNYSEARWNLALAQLLCGDYHSGWKNYQSRWKRKKVVIPHAIPKTEEWKGERLHPEEDLIIVSEQGLGDTLQYMRYILYLKKKGMRISFCAQTKLHNLIKSSGIDSDPLTPKETNNITSGKWIPLLSLPRYLKITPNHPIIKKPYIFTTLSLFRKWKRILEEEKKPIIGICWQGNPEMEKSYRNRSIALESFSKIIQNNKINLLSLQKGFGSEQLENCSFREKFVSSQEKINSTWSFLENSAIIANCDLIITCDTAVAHLAGGMGKSVWLLLKDIPYWTWGLSSEKTFWYPTMKLFRQNKKNDWEELMDRVCLELNNRFNLL